MNLYTSEVLKFDENKKIEEKKWYTFEFDHLVIRVSLAPRLSVRSLRFLLKGHFVPAESSSPLQKLDRSAISLVIKNFVISGSNSDIHEAASRVWKLWVVWWGRGGRGGGGGRGGRRGHSGWGEDLQEEQRLAPAEEQTAHPPPHQRRGPYILPLTFFQEILSQSVPRVI